MCSHSAKAGRRARRAVPPPGTTDRSIVGNLSSRAGSHWRRLGGRHRSEIRALSDSEVLMERIPRRRSPLRDLDKRIIGVLRDAPRMPVAELARLLDGKPETIGARLRALRRKGTIRFTAVEAAPASAFALISVRPGAVEQVISSIAEIEEASLVAETTGRSSLLIELTLRDAAHLSDLLHRRIGPVAGVDGVEAWIALAVVKKRASRRR
ncbi:Lrp/AsnC family transcriptional regulator [Leifsonia xyli]|uniref:Lrp/AsnC family transcriptional regulator n=1 Tax=Leifsonia xyli TaxID=1575 RepID=UPI003D669710